MNVIHPFAHIGGFTAFDNNILDYVMPICAPNTWKIVCATIRKTIGWGKETDLLSFSQYQSMTGIVSRETLHAAVTDALERGFIVREKAGKGYAYALNKDYEMTIGTEIVPVDRYENRTNIGTEIVHTKERKKSITSSRVRDDRLDHPAMLAYRDLARLYVPVAWRDQVCALEDLDLWAEIVKTWVGSGWNPGNVKGMLEAYAQGGLLPKNGKTGAQERNLKSLMALMNEGV